MRRADYYETMKLLAAQKRKQHGVVTARLGLQMVRAIYKAESIVIDLRKTSSHIRAVYMCDGDDPSVLGQSNPPKNQELFAAMVHELKHHYCDQATPEKRRNSLR